MLVLLDLDCEDRVRAGRAFRDIILHALPTARKQIRAKQVPPLYASGVRYVRQPMKPQHVKTPVEVYAAGGGDCKQLVLWRLAELHELDQELDAWPRVVWLEHDPVTREKVPGFLAHAQIRRASKLIECPSLELGMR